jgi:hypothetical protein
MAIPAERIITGAKLLGTWEPVTGSTQNPPLSQILADGVPVAQIDPSATLPQPWSYDLAGDLEYLRSTGISMKLKVLGTGFIGVGPTRLEIQTVPEPGTVALWSLAGVTCLGVGLWRRRRRA